MHPKPLLATIVALALAGAARSPAGVGDDAYVHDRAGEHAFALKTLEAATPVWVAPDEWPGVTRAAGDFCVDVEKVTGTRPGLVSDASQWKGMGILAGTVGHSSLIDALVRAGKLDASGLTGKWDAYTLKVVDSPMPGVDRALVVVGSNKRGTIYGLYELSQQIGVSPWYWWADVPVRHRDTLWVDGSLSVFREPSVKYRGLFLNDEAPALSGWTKEKFGGYNHEFYTKVFELILRLRGNALWPAMWSNRFNEDDPQNPVLADEYGIVMGTSHHEPMMRAQKEWTFHGKGPWDYSQNGEFLRSFWTDGVRRNRAYENLYTIGMRGDGDKPMSQATDVPLLERIVADQREILKKEVNPDLTAIPQVFALYKEVQTYYENGMKVPPDVTLLWSDDNFGNVRRLPTAAERQARTGGAGIYYHVDYVGDPRNYKWICTVPIEKIQEQMDMAYRYGADRLWILNVGDLKPMEFDIEFFLEKAWSPDRWGRGSTDEFAQRWAAREFGPEHAHEIADAELRTLRLLGRRKPEVMEPSTYSASNYREAERFAAECRDLNATAGRLSDSLPMESRDAFFELVGYPALASTAVNSLYLATGMNRLYAAQGRPAANAAADLAARLFQDDADLAYEYNHRIANGKWDHMMDQIHLGYTYWNDPPKSVAPALMRVTPASSPSLGVAIDGSAEAWPASPSKAVLPTFDSVSRESSFIDLFNKGTGSLACEVNAPAWVELRVSSKDAGAPGWKGSISGEQRLWVSVNWDKAAGPAVSGSIVAVSGRTRVEVQVRALRPARPSGDDPDGYVESDGVIAIEANHPTRAATSAGGAWKLFPHYGRTGASMGILPVTADPMTPPDAPFLEYRIYLTEAAPVSIACTFAPSLPVSPGRGLRYAISVDDQPPQTVDFATRAGEKAWSEGVKDNARISTTPFPTLAAGPHLVRVWGVDPGVLLQRLVIDCGGLRPSYLGPPESALWRPASGESN